MDKAIFEVEISCGGPRGYETATVMKMPATWAEFNDALQKARIEDARVCENELTHIQYSGFPKDIISRDVNLYELNLLAQRLATLDEVQRTGLNVLLKMEKEHKSGFLPLEKIINLTYNTDTCLFAPRVTNHRELGALLYESEMLSKEAMALLDTIDPDSDIRNKLLEVFGEQHQEDHGGIFTKDGYAELGKDIEERYVYRPGEMTYFHRSGAPVVLEVRKGFFNDSAYDNDLVTVLDLPAVDAAVWRAVEAVDAASPEECSFRCVDCLIPSLRDAVNNAIEEDGGIEQAGEFAKLLAQKERVWGTAEFVKYKALLSASGSPCLSDAVQLMADVDQYEFRSDVTQPWSYAEAVLQNKYPDLPAALFQTAAAAEIGRAMLEERNGILTDYGMIRRKDGQPIRLFQPEQDTGSAFSEQEEGGMTFA